MVVVGFVFGGWDAADVVEQALVVEPVDPFEGGVFEVVEATAGSPVVHQLGFVQSYDRLG